MIAAYAAAIALFVAGHIVRDGWPPLGTTHGARALGAALCTLGLLLVYPWLTALKLGAAVLAGFYFDMKHGDGQGADNWASEGYLTLSGVTSLAPLALVGGYLFGLNAALGAVAGLLKSAIWPAAWALLRGRQDWFIPTRIAAAVFGAIVGAVACLLPVM